MKVLLLAIAVSVSTFGITSASADLLEEFKQEKFEILQSLNQRYIAEFEKQKQQAMRDGDLAGANAADRLVKEFSSQQEQLEAEHNKALLIASLAGDWRLASSGWSFKIFADGSVTASEPIRERGRIQVIDYEKRTVRMTGFAQAMTWVVTEGAKSLFGTQHPAERIDKSLKLEIELEKLLAEATEAAKQGPRNAAELAGHLHGTTWNISNAIEDGDVLYTMTFNKNGTFKQSDGRVGKLQFLGARSFRLWNYDPAVLNDNLKQFRAVGSATVYFGNLNSRQ